MKNAISIAIRNARRARLSRCPKQSRRLQVEALRALGLGKVAL